MTEQVKTYGLIALALAGGYLLFRNKDRLMAYLPGAGNSSPGDGAPGREPGFSVRNPLMASIEMGFPRGYYNTPGNFLPPEPSPSNFSIKRTVSVDPIELGSYAYVN